MPFALSRRGFIGSAAALSAAQATMTDNIAAETRTARILVNVIFILPETD